MSWDASEVARNCASHYEARQQYLRDSEDEFHRRQRDWQRINQLERALDASTRRVDELCAENERLRGLCVKALEWLRWAGGITCPPEVPDEFADSLRKLGIEVD